MSERAQITSIEAIDSFRASLITYMETARPTLDGITSEVMRIRQWLEQDRLRHWERELKHRHRLLHEAEDALRSARMSQLREVTDAEVSAVRKAKAAYEATEERLRRVKRWCRDFDSRIAPLAHQLDSLQTLFAMDLPRAIASLTQTLDLLHDYAGPAPAENRPAPESILAESPAPSEEPGGAA